MKYSLRNGCSIRIKAAYNSYKNHRTAALWTKEQFNNGLET